MTRRTLLTVTGVIAFSIGSLALIAPSILMEQVKVAAPSASANVMARTVGVLLLAVGLLNLLVRRHGDSPTMRAIVVVNLLLQLAIMPIDPLAFAAGTFRTLGSFLPNTILHVLLAVSFAREVLRSRQAPAATNTAASGRSR